MTNKSTSACDGRLDEDLIRAFPAGDPVAIAACNPHAGVESGVISQRQPRESLNDPWVYMAEIAHRTINEYTIAIAMLSRIASSVSDDRTRLMLQEVVLRMRNAARTQHVLASPPRTGEIDLADYLQPLCEAISAFALKEKEIFLTLSCEPINLNSTQCWRVGLIVFELIMNARRHAFADQGGLIRVEINREGGEINCHVFDNGRGMQTFAPGRGSQLVEALAADLGGTINRPPTDKGTSVHLLFSSD